MISVSLNEFSEAKHFSDWRLYAKSITGSCALEGLHATKDFSSIGGSERSWLLYDRLTGLMQKFCTKLIEACVEHSDSWLCFNVDLTDGSNRLRYRVQEMGGFFACKQILTIPPNLDDLSGLNEPVKSLLLSPKWRNSGGLVLMVGDTGTGKTTTASAAVRERLKKMGDIASFWLIHQSSHWAMPADTR